MSGDLQGILQMVWFNSILLLDDQVCVFAFMFQMKIQRDGEVKAGTRVKHLGSPTGQVALSTSFQVSKPEFADLENEDNNDTTI